MSRVYESIIRVGAAISKTFAPETQKAAKAMAALGAATAAAKTKYNAASDALRRLEAAEKAAGGATKESTKWRKAGERAVAAAAREMDRATKAAEKNAKAMRNLDSARVMAAKKSLFGDSSKPAPLFQKAGQQIGGIARDVLYLGTAATGAAAAMAGLVLKSLTKADEIGDTADKLKISSDALQELRYGAEQSGAEVGALDKAIGKMLVNVGHFKAAKGKGGGGGFSIPGMQMLGKGGESKPGGDADPFKRIGLSAKDLAKLRPEEQLKKIADAMKVLKTDADRAAVGQAIFGKGAKEIEPFLLGGSAAIDKAAIAAHRYGGVLDKDAIAAADEADKAMRDASMAMTGLTNTLGSALLPTAVKVFREFSEWVANNREQIKEWAATVAKWISDVGVPSLKKIAREALQFGKAMAGLVGGAANLVGGFNRLGYAMVALRFAPLALTITKIGVEVVKAADGFFKYAQAVKAANAAGGIAGGDIPALSGAGKAIGAAATASMVLGAASVGYAIGTFLDEQLGISDWLARAAVGKEETNKSLIQSGTNIIASKYQKGVSSDALRTSTGSVVQFSPTYHVGAGGSKSDIEKKLDESHAKAKTKLFDEIDKLAAHRRRVAFGE